MGSRRWSRPVRGIALALAVSACAAAHVEVVVEDEAGKPVPGARVSCASPPVHLAAVETNRRGRVDVPSAIGLQPLRWCEVSRDGYQGTGPLEVPGRAGRLRITLHALPPVAPPDGSEPRPP